MVTLETNFRELQRNVGKEFSLKELEETLFDLGMELDESEGDALKIDITPDRPDMVSTHGLARVLRAYYGLGNPDYSVKRSGYNILIDKNVKGIRPFTVCAVVKNLDLDDIKIKEIIWVQEKLHETYGRKRKKAAIGIYPMESIKFPINFKTLKPGEIRFVPLSAKKEMTSKEILETTSVGRNYAHLLKGMERYPVFVDDDSHILSMPPIVNSQTTGKITEDTKEIFIECSGFDFEALSHTLNILTYMFYDMGGEVFSLTLKYPDKEIITPDFSKERRTISKEFIEMMTGLSLDIREYTRLLEKMFYEIVSVDKKKIIFNVPPIRVDIWHDVDIADDIVRGYGVNNIKPRIPEVPTFGWVILANRVKSVLTELLIGLGFHEVFTLALTDKDDQYTKMRLPIKKHIKLGHTTEQSINMVRIWMIPELIKVLSHNRHIEMPQNLFEMSRVVVPDPKSDVLSSNEMRLSCVLCGKNSGYTPSKQALEYLSESIGIKKVKYNPYAHKSFIKGRCAHVILKNKNIGLIGELHPEVLEKWGIDYPVSAFEINIDVIADEII